MMYWGWSGTGAVQASHIEATSYALLAMLQLDDLRASNETVKWLSLHRSSGGAFRTTQVYCLFSDNLMNNFIHTFKSRGLHRKSMGGYSSCAEDDNISIFLTLFSLN